MRFVAILTSLVVFGWWTNFTVAQDERLEETVCISRPQTEGVTYRIANGKFSILFQRKGLAKSAKPGQKTLLILTSEEPGAFSPPEIKKGAFIESYAVLPERRKNEDISQTIPLQSSYANTVFIEIDWRKPFEDDDPIQQIETEAMKMELRRRGVGEKMAPDRPFQVRQTLEGVLPSAEELKKELTTLGYRAETFRRGKDGLIAAYIEHLQKQALLKALGLKYGLEPSRIRLASLEKLALPALRLPGLCAYLGTPPAGANDRAEKALAWFSNRASALYAYVTEAPGAAERLGREDREAADAAFGFSIKAVFVPDESGQESAATAGLTGLTVERPFSAGLLGDPLKEIELNGATDPHKGILVHWWSLQVLHPRNFAISANENMAKTHVFYVLPGSNKANVLIRIRGIGTSAAQYAIKCTDTILAKGESARFFANDRPLTGGFPY